MQHAELQQMLCTPISWCTQAAPARKECSTLALRHHQNHQQHFCRKWVADLLHPADVAQRRIVLLSCGSIAHAPSRHA